MKRLLILLLTVLLVVALASCKQEDAGDGAGTDGENANQEEAGNGTEEEVDTYESLCNQLNVSTSMSGAEYSQGEIDTFEARFTKMSLSGGFKRVKHFRSTEEYAYVIEFEIAGDADTFYQKIGASGSYDVELFGSVVVYGKSGIIDNLE